MTTGTDPVHSERCLSRRTFLMWGLGLFAVKFLTDHLVATLAFGRPWSPLNYLIPTETFTLFTLPPAERAFYLTMATIASPIVVVGIVLTVRRLRDAGLSRRSVVLFFVPLVNLVFFAVLSVLRSRRSASSIEIPYARVAPRGIAEDSIEYGLSEEPAGLGGWMPVDGLRSGIVSAALTVPVAVLITILAVTVLRNYGWGLFLGLPFVIGFIAALLHGSRRPRTLKSSIGVGVVALIVAGVSLIAVAIEGFGCLIMLFPLACPIAILGAAVGHSIQAHARAPGNLRNAALAALIVLPMLLGAESTLTRVPRIREVSSAIEIDAPPDVVWRNVIGFSRIAPPTDWVFLSGVAYPVRARIIGRGVGATRYCEFSTGAFVEPIEVWQEPSLLKFGVVDNPPPMHELSPFDIHPPHLKNFLVARHGQFKLEALPGNRTLVVGTTWYEHSLWPEAYWGLWSDFIIHRIHMRVLEHVKRESEMSASVASND